MLTDKEIEELKLVFNDGEVNMEVIQQHMEIIDNAATQIQKSWRGYFTRKCLTEYFEELYKKYEEENQGFQEYHP